MNFVPMDIITSRMDSILIERESTRIAQFAQAERMMKSLIDIAHGHPDDIAAVPIRGDPLNILGVILERNEYNMYTICVKSGILKSKYAHN